MANSLRRKKGYENVDGWEVRRGASPRRRLRDMAASSLKRSLKSVEETWAPEALPPNPAHMDPRLRLLGLPQRREGEPFASQPHWALPKVSPQEGGGRRL